MIYQEDAMYWLCLNRTTGAAEIVYAAVAPETWDEVYGYDDEGSAYASLDAARDEWDREHTDHAPMQHFVCADCGAAGDLRPVYSRSGEVAYWLCPRHFARRDEDLRRFARGE